MSDAVSSIVTILLAIIGVAIVAVLVSPSAQTGNVLMAGGGAFSNILSSALSPIQGGGGILGANMGALGNGLLSGFTGSGTGTLY